MERGSRHEVADRVGLGLCCYSDGSLTFLSQTFVTPSDHRQAHVPVISKVHLMDTLRLSLGKGRVEQRV
jgi:hypothetical protein